MPEKVRTKRYAQAVFELALEKDELDLWQSDLRKIAGVLGEKDYLVLLENPKVKIDDKSRLISESLRDISPMARNLVLMLISRGNIAGLPEIAAEYGRLLDAHFGRQTARVITAVPLDDSDKGKLARELSSCLGKQVVLETEVDSQILGGIVARVDGKLLDGSARSKLEALKREIGGN